MSSHSRKPSVKPVRFVPRPHPTMRGDPEDAAERVQYERAWVQTTRRNVNVTARRPKAPKA